MRGIIFDFNGTMFFDEKFQEVSWRTFIEQKTGHHVTDEEFQEYIHGRNNEVTISYFIQPELPQEELARLEEEKEVIYRKLCLESPAFKLEDGLPEFLDELKKLQIPFTIATASGRKNVEFFFEHLELDEWFDFEKVVYADGSLPGKPEPDLYLKAAELLGIEPAKCIVFEDSRSGVKAGERAGACKVVGVASMQGAEDLLSQGATDIITGYENLELLMDIVKEEI